MLRPSALCGGRPIAGGRRRPTVSRRSWARVPPRSCWRLPSARLPPCPCWRSCRRCCCWPCWRTDRCSSPATAPKPRPWRTSIFLAICASGTDTRNTKTEKFWIAPVILTTEKPEKRPKRQFWSIGSLPRVLQRTTRQWHSAGKSTPTDVICCLYAQLISSSSEDILRRRVTRRPTTTYCIPTTPGSVSWGIAKMCPMNLWTWRIHGGNSISSSWCVPLPWQMFSGETLERKWTNWACRWRDWSRFAIGRARGWPRGRTKEIAVPHKANKHKGRLKETKNKAKNKNMKKLLFKANRDIAWLYRLKIRYSLSRAVSGCNWTNVFQQFVHAGKRFVYLAQTLVSDKVCI